MKAIRETGNHLLAALDQFDSVGVIDSFFPEADFFTEFERFDRHLELLKRRGASIDYVSVCTPNYLHDAHIRFGLRHGAHVICEKPLVLNPWNVEPLAEIEAETGKKVNTILQLRLHPNVQQLRKMVAQAPAGRVFDVELTYITSRGRWYYTSWKGETSKSGGIATNIGIHFFDMLGWVFGKLRSNTVHLHTHDRAAGYLEFDRARVRWFLSIEADTLPQHIRELGIRTYRSVTIDGQDFEFSQGFSDLHTLSYEEVIAGRGFGLREALPAIELVHRIRNTPAEGPSGNHHPLAELPIAPHPFNRN